MNKGNVVDCHMVDHEAYDDDDVDDGDNDVHEGNNISEDDDDDKCEEDNVDVGDVRIDGVESNDGNDDDSW
ncbi:unnamed protein product [Angiostrongylus costaricensis]|uniref:Uncharacterized protein n=1 Tax=Angiostrongylus costaricensis TaxID=334426 RepID=A0A0R3PCB4_ANGCS|nr:unnamed protein product [Angiostrongylus costaricensis]